MPHGSRAWGWPYPPPEPLSAPRSGGGILQRGARCLATGSLWCSLHPQSVPLDLGDLGATAQLGDGVGLCDDRLLLCGDLARKDLAQLGEHRPKVGGVLLPGAGDGALDLGRCGLGTMVLNYRIATARTTAYYRIVGGEEDDPPHLVRAPVRHMFARACGSRLARVLRPPVGDPAAA